MVPELHYIPKDELAHLTAIAKAGGPAVRDTLYEYALLRGRKARKGRRDYRNDMSRRILVGARIPREYAYLIARAADLEGVSLYQFCRDVLMERAREITGFSTISDPFVEGVPCGDD